MNVQQTSINAIRILSAEAIQKAKSGHPGLPMGSAPIGYTLFQNFLKFNPGDLTWENRDRFVLSAGHGSMLQYALFHLYGMGLSMEDLKDFRQLNAKTPGHPEYRKTAGVETTTGPLGQGIANAVGMALAEAHLAAKYNRPGYNVVDHYTYVVCGDGCLQEGIAYEACSFAGANKLGKLILLYDDNDITIEGDMRVTFKENVGARFAAQNWQVLHVDLATKVDDVQALTDAIKMAQARTDKPSIIICHTNIGQGSPLQGSEKCHGAPLGADALQKSKEILGWEYPPFECPQEVYDHCAVAGKTGENAQKVWQELFRAYEGLYPELAKEYKAVMANEMPDFASVEGLYDFEKPMATRQCSSKVLNTLAAKLPQLMGGSADLGPSNQSIMKDTDSVTYGDFSADNLAGRNMHFGIREHAMAAICNGMQLHGGVQAYCATFFVFSDYCKPAMRLSALMQLPVTYIMTHDSIGVGEDGPTHQPIEQLVMLRSIPGIKVFRPVDGKETAAAWVSALSGKEPTVLVLSRQTLPQYAGSDGKSALKGGYVFEDCEGAPDVLLMTSGSEMEICMQAKAALAEKGVQARVISMPCIEEFEKQSDDYKESVLPSAVKARVAVEAASPHGWYKYVGSYGETVCMETFGASAPAGVLFPYFGFTAENVVEKALRSIKKSK